MDRSAKAVISQVLGDSITPLLQRNGFDRRGRTYNRERKGRHELIEVQPGKGSNRYGGSFTVNLGLFIPEVDAVVSLYPQRQPPGESECQIRCRIGDVASDGRIRTDTSVGADPWRGWWEFDAFTDRAAFGADVRTWFAHHALSFFDHLSTPAGVLDWVRRTSPPRRRPELPAVALAAYAGEASLAQSWLDDIAADAGPAWSLHDVARIAARLGLTGPALTDRPAVTAVFRMAADSTHQERRDAFYHLDYKFREYVGLLRTVLPVDLYHTTECTELTGTVNFYGADPEDLLPSLRRAFTKLSAQYADITVTSVER